MTFENGTSETKDQYDGSNEIGVQMLFQLAGDNNKLDFPDFSLVNRNVTLSQVLNELAQGEQVDKENMTVLILVDGTHTLLHTNGDNNSKMKQAINLVVSLIDGGPYFCIGVFAATSYTPLEQTLNKSPQLCISLVPPALNGHFIIPSNDSIVKIFIEDMGGHG